MCRRQQQDEMIERDVMQWLVQLLGNCDMISDYMLEYAVALLMNLCLRSAGQHQQQQPSQGRSDGGYMGIYTPKISPKKLMG